MFYGRIRGGDGGISPPAASSNNFSVSEDTNTSQWVLTLSMWTYYEPIFAICDSIDEVNDAAITCTYSISRTNPSPYNYGPWTVTICGYDTNGNRSLRNISFQGRCGVNRIFAATDLLTLTPVVIDFNGTKVLAITTTIGEEEVYLDAGTVLTGVGTSMKLQLASTSVTDVSGNNTWTLSGWTYGIGSGSNGSAWSTDGGNSLPYFQLDADPALGGPATTPYLFAIKGVQTAGSGYQYIATDPIIRLTSVPPCGISI